MYVCPREVQINLSLGIWTERDRLGCVICIQNWNCPVKYLLHLCHATKPADHASAICFIPLAFYHLSPHRCRGCFASSSTTASCVAFWWWYGRSLVVVVVVIHKTYRDIVQFNKWPHFLRSFSPSAAGAVDEEIRPTTTSSCSLPLLLKRPKEKGTTYSAQRSNCKEGRRTESRGHGDMTGRVKNLYMDGVPLIMPRYTDDDDAKKCIWKRVAVDRVVGRSVIHSASFSSMPAGAENMQ